VRFALAVLLVCGFGGLAVYWPSTATKRCIGWLWRSQLSARGSAECSSARLIPMTSVTTKPTKAPVYERHNYQRQSTRKEGG